jgi:hypothetical protein
VEEERLRVGGGRPGRRRLTPGRTAGEGSREREDGGGRRLRSEGQQRDARVGQIGEGEPAIEVQAHCQIPNLPFFLPNFD